MTLVWAWEHLTPVAHDTDRVAAKIRAHDLPVEFVFRRIHLSGGRPNYYWKASPIPEAGPLGEPAAKETRG